MADFTNQAFNPNFSRELDIESMIGAPLVAASKANVIMVTGQTRFLLEYCFTKDNNNCYSPVMIKMSMTKGVIDETKEAGDPDHFKQVQLIFSVPLLCIIPLNSLAVDKVSIDFDMEITSAIQDESKSANGSDRKITDHTAILNGKIGNAQNQGVGSGAGSHYKHQTSNHLKVSLNASPLPLPTGVLTILDIYTKAIQPIAVGASTAPEKKASQISNNP